MWFTCSTKGGKNIEAPIFEITKCITARNIEMARNTGDATKDCKGREV
jgi:hypothetical protein